MYLLPIFLWSSHDESNIQFPNQASCWAVHPLGYSFWYVCMAITGSWASRLRTVSKLVHMSKLSRDQKRRNDFRIEDWMKVVSKWRENWARDEFLIAANISHRGPIPRAMCRVIASFLFPFVRTDSETTWSSVELVGWFTSIASLFSDDQGKNG